MNRLRSQVTFTFVTLGILCIILASIFHQAQSIGGATWDEASNHARIKAQLDLAKRWISGDSNAHFSQLPGHTTAHYGIVSVFPAYLAEKLAKSYKLANPRGVYTYFLHATAFACYLLTLIFTYLILIRVPVRQSTALIGTGLLAIFPLWIGFSFFDFKDVPTAAFATMALYASIGLLQTDDEREKIIGFTGLLALATILIAGIKIAALLLIVPSWLAAFFVLVRRRRVGTLLSLCILSAVGIFAVTPVAWSDPTNYISASLTLMARHPWSRCTLTNGDCMSPVSADWSANRYIWAWFIAQTPVLIGIGAIGGLVMAPRKGLVATTIATSAVLPLILIIVRNSTLYDGLRQLLFEVPLVFILSTMFWHDVVCRSGLFIVGIFCIVAQFGLFMWDNVALFPYNYVYYNLPTRQIADDRNFETDFWGFSLKEAAELPAVTHSSSIVIGNPKHLVAPFLPRERTIVSMEVAAKLARFTDAVLISYMRWRPMPVWCSDPEYVVRRLPLGGRPLHLSFAAHCVTE